MSLMRQQQLKLSVVVPVYNEEARIENCLLALMNQKQPVHQILVVDNNCTDRTAEIASSIAGVTVIQEPVQGLIAARNSGFAAATGDIIARIDADTIVSPGWSTEVLAGYADDSVAAATGSARMHLLPGVFNAKTTFWSATYLLYVRGYFRFPVLWGANMSIRKSVWAQIKTQCLSDDTLIHEDQDISRVLFLNRHKITMYPAGISDAEASDYTNLRKHFVYRRMKKATKRILRKTPNKPSYPVGIAHSLIIRISMVPIEILLVLGILAYSAERSASKLLTK
jgi:glycosyltransferase involved in cell wall biosynthesis